jgi:hypothetical protein
LQVYATFFATTRSMDGAGSRLLDEGELTDMEWAVKEDLNQELARLRVGALGTASRLSATSSSPSVRSEEENIESLNSGYWRFADGKPVTIVCVQPDGQYFQVARSGSEPERHRPVVERVGDRRSCVRTSRCSLGPEIPSTCEVQ